MNKTTVPIKGMHCRSCPLIIEEKLKELSEIKKVEVDYKAKKATIYSEDDLTEGEIRSKIIEAGYDVGIEEPKSWISRDPVILKDLFYAASFFIVLYLIVRNFDISGLGIGSISKPSNFAIIVLIGLAAGFSSCMALVGGLVLGISARYSESHPEASVIQKFKPHLFFNFGRIASYVILGGLIGLLGKAFQLSGTSLGALTIIVGLVMILVGLQLTEISPKLANISISLPGFIGRRFGLGNNKQYNSLNSMVIGALTFFLPCGFTQAMQLYAMTTGHFGSGALIMGLFALGTAPGLLSIGGLTSIARGVFAKRFFKFAGLAVIAFALINISNGLGLAGYSIDWNLGGGANNNSQSSTNSVVSTDNNSQVINMDQLANGYQPNSFTIKKDIPVKWVINSKSSGCSSSIYSSDLNIRKILEPGENIIEFTAQKIGKISFSCSMGMYRGSFNVIN